MGTQNLGGVGMKGNYVCRRCSKVVESNPQPWTVRVTCYWCGGTCDPTPSELKRLNLHRRVAKEHRIKNIKYSVGYGTNSQVNKHNEIVGIKPEDLE